MARKTTFSEMFEAAQEEVKKAPVPAEELKERLLKMLDKTLSPEGKQAAMKPITFPKESDYTAFREQVEKFMDSLPEEHKPGRLYVTNEDACDFHVDAVHMAVFSKYTLLLEEDKNRADSSWVLRIILNKGAMSARLKSFFEELDFTNLTPKLMEQVMAHMDLHGGIDVTQLTCGDFKKAYGQRKDWFRFGNAYALYDMGGLVLTHPQWKHSVSLKMPTDGRKPWRYRYEKDEHGYRYEAYFRVNLYGALWFNPKEKNKAEEV